MESLALNLMDAKECYRISLNLAGHSRISMATPLDHAWESGFDLLFKGGISLLLLLNPIRRLSIDHTPACP